MWRYLLIWTLVTAVGLLRADDIRVRDYGAFPNDGQDDTLQIQRAIHALKDGDRLLFERGQYDLQSLSSLAKPLVFQNLRNVVVVGANALFMLHRFDPTQTDRVKTPFRFQNCTNLYVHNLAIDMTRAPFSVGKVLAVDTQNRAIEVSFFREFPVNRKIVLEHLMTYHPNGLPDGLGFDLHFSGGDYTVTELGPQRLRIQVQKGSVGSVKVGALIVATHQKYRTNAFHADSCEGLRLENILIYTVPGMALVGTNLKDLTVRRFAVLRKPGTLRLMSTTADGIHLIWTQGRVEISDCVFAWMGDDALNLHNFYLTVTSLRFPNQVIAREPKPMWTTVFQPGDQVQFFDSNLFPTRTAKLLAFASAPDGITHTLTFPAMPAGVRPGAPLTNLSRLPGQVTVRHVLVRNNRARGFLIQVRNVLVEDCRFENTTGAAIHVTTDYDYWYEALPTRRVVIRGCTAKNVNHGAARREGAFNVFCDVQGRANGRAGVHEDLRFEGNTVEQTPGSAFFVNAARRVVLQANVMKDVSLQGGGTWEYAIYLKNCDDVVLSGNRLTGQYRQYLGLQNATNVAFLDDRRR